MNGKCEKCRMVRRMLMRSAAALLAVFTVVCCILPAFAADNPPEVLFISSYSCDWPAFPLQLDGISSTLGAQATVHYLFMDTKQESEDTAEKQLCAALEEQTVKSYDAVLLGDDAALLFAQKYKERYFPNTPLVFFGINNEMTAREAAKDPMMTGVIETLPFEKTIETAHSIYADAFQVVAITDSTVSGKGAEEQFRKAMESESLRSLDCVVLNAGTMTVQELQNTLAGYGQETILLFLILSKDGEGNCYTISQATDLVTGAASVPVFKVDELGIGEGILGGTVISYRDMAAEGCKLILQILNGADPSSFPVQTAAIHSEYDQQVLEQYGISKSALPEDAEFVNEAPSYYSQHKPLVLSGAAIVAILCVFLTIVLYDNRRRRSLVKKLQTQDAQFQKLMDTLPDGIGIFEENPNGGVCVTFLNDGFYRMIGAQRKGRWEDTKKELLHFIHPDDQAGIVTELEHVRRTGDRFCDTFRLMDGSGQYLWVTLRANVIRQKDSGAVYYGSFTNVNTIKLIQEQLQESKSSLQTAMNHAGMVYFEYFPDRHVAIEDARSQMEFGVPNLIENYPESWFEMKLTHPDDVPVQRELFSKIDQGEQEASCEVRCRNVAGEYRWTRIRMTSIFDRSGNRLKLIGTCVDTTEQKTAAAEYERQMAQVKAAIPDPVVSFRVNLTQNNFHDTETDYADLKETGDSTADSLFEAMYGRSVTEQERDAFALVFNRNNLLDTFDRGETTIVYERRAWISGKIHWISVRVYMARNPITGDVEALIYSFSIDEQKNMEQIVSSVIQNDYMALLQINLRDNTLRAFSTSLRMYIKPGEQPDAEAVLEQKLRYRYVGDDVEAFIRSNRFAEIRRHLEKDGEYTQYASYYDQDGSIRRTKSVYMWLDEIEQRVCYTVSDITDAFEEEQRRNEELHTALKQAEQASRTKTDFLSRMSHEIRTPMNAILGLTNLGLNDCKDAVAKEYLSKINASGTYLLGLINDVLDMSRIESGKILLNPASTDTEKFFNSILTIISPQMQGKKINFHLETAGAQVPYAVIDKMRMQQVYINLLNNAVKFSDPGTTITCLVRHEACADDPTMFTSTIVIRDQGCGMSREFLQRMFQPFEQEHNRYSDAQPGTGLGLAIVKNLIDQMGGTISVKSELDVGTEFTIVLKAPYGHKPEDEVEEQHLPNVSLKGRRVLLVEDHPTNTEIARRLLEREGMLVDHASNGQKAVDQFRTSPIGYYDVILMDIRMPVMDGIQATRLIRATPEREDAMTIPMIAMTANAFDTDRQETKAAGMNAHLSKPIFPKELYDTLRRFVGK